MSSKNLIPVFDLHGDLYSHFTRGHMLGESDIFKKYHLEHFKKGNEKFAVFNVWIDDETVSAKHRALDILTYSAKEVLQNKDVLHQIVSRNDLDNLDLSKVNFIVGLEGIDYLDNAQQIYMMYAYGARLISLTWNHSNVFATSVTAPQDEGLTDQGREAVAIMNELGIVIDLSHLSDKSALEILALSNAPVVASHSNVRALCSHPRNVSDELILAIAKSGGVIGMNAYPAFVSTNEDEKNIEGLIKHVEYINNLVGIDHIALGFDFMDFLAEDALDSFIVGSPYMDDLKNQKDIQDLLNQLLAAGFTREQVEKIAYKNAMRVLKTVLK